MSILDVFKIVFKAESSDAVKGIKQVEDAQVSLQKTTDKGEDKNKKTHQEEDKRYKEKSKQTKETINNSKKLKQAHDELADTILNTAAKLAAPFGLAVGAFELFNKTVGEAKGVINMNANLGLLSQRTHQTVRELAGLNAAAKQFGGAGNEGDMIAEIITQRKQAGLLPVNMTISEFLRNVQANVRAQNGDVRGEQNIFSANGIPPALQNLFLSSNDIVKTANGLADLAQASEKSAQESLKFNQELDRLNTRIGGYFTTGLIPFLQLLNGEKPSAITDLQNSVTPSKDEQRRRANELIEKNKNHISPESSNDNLKQSMAFWLSQGLTPNQAAGLVANEQQESGGKTTALGDAGKSLGVFQWSAARRADILAGTGIDISTASHADQLKAAEWELKKRGNWNQLLGTSSAYDAAGVISNNFEIPANGQFEAARRGLMAGKIAIDNATNSPAGFSLGNAGNSTNVKIDNINIHTSATDPDGIAKHVASSLQFHINDLNANNNTSILA